MNLEVVSAVGGVIHDGAAVLFGVFQASKLTLLHDFFSFATRTND
jgi:hypothetical protein